MLDLSEQLKEIRDEHDKKRAFWLRHWPSFTHLDALTAAWAAQHPGTTFHLFKSQYSTDELCVAITPAKGVTLTAMSPLLAQIMEAGWEARKTYDSDFSRQFVFEQEGVRLEVRFWMSESAKCKKVVVGKVELDDVKWVCEEDLTAADVGVPA